MKEELILNVPFHEKEEVKMLGARWNPEIKKWYVPRGQSPRPFQRWMLKEQKQNQEDDSHKNNRD